MRFRKVNDSRMFAIKLDNIINGSNKIHVNIPRFNREWSERNPKTHAPVQNKHHAAPLVQKVWKKKEGNSGVVRGGEYIQGKKKVHR